MIISASRRTDLPAYYSKWLMNRFRAGFCLVPNPFNPGQVARLSLLPGDVEVIVFWTRDARPMMDSLAELDRMGHRYMFLVTVVDYPAALGPGDLRIEEAISMMQRLARRIGPERVVWRYDPIVFSNVTDAAFHKERFLRMAGALRHSTRRVVVSGLSMYRRNVQMVEALAKAGIVVCPKEKVPDAQMRELLETMAHAAASHGLELVSCAETLDWRRIGILPGRCIDHELIWRAFKVNVPAVKDPGQRPACGCVVSRDIGVYNTCVRGCPYCYAVSDTASAKSSFRLHDPDAPSLMPLRTKDSAGQARQDEFI